MVSKEIHQRLLEKSHNHEMQWDSLKEVPSILIVGSQGSGKTNTLHYLQWRFQHRACSARHIRGLFDKDPRVGVGLDDEGQKAPPDLIPWVTWVTSQTLVPWRARFDLLIILPGSQPRSGAHKLGLEGKATSSLPLTQTNPYGGFVSYGSLQNWTRFTPFQPGVLQVLELGYVQFSFSLLDQRRTQTQLSRSQVWEEMYRTFSSRFIEGKDLFYLITSYLDSDYCEICSSLQCSSFRIGNFICNDCGAYLSPLERWDRMQVMEEINPRMACVSLVLTAVHPRKQ